MSQKCCGSADNIMILPCSGRSNVGQMSNQAALELTQEGFGKMFCTAAVGARLDGFVKSARSAPDLVAIDGCSVGCVRAILESLDIPLKNHFVIEELGIEKNMGFDLKREEIDSVKEAIKGSRGKQEVDTLADSTVSTSCFS